MKHPEEASEAEARAARMREALEQLWDLEDELGIEREGYEE